MPLKTTTDAWKKSTSHMIMSRNNPLITDVDNLLTAYAGNTGNPLKQLKILLLIHHFTKEYLIANDRCFFDPDSRAVQALHTEVALELKTPEMKKAAAERVEGRRGHGYLPGKGLATDVLPAYAAEMLQPRMKPIYAEKYGLEWKGEPQRMKAAEIDITMSDRFGNLPDLPDLLDAIHEKGARHEIRDNLQYLNNAERQKQEIHLRQGLWCLAGSENPYSTPPRFSDLWVMDEFHSLYVYSLSDEVKECNFHHSSFLSGKPVLCGGGISILNGVITTINNSSGHYRPGTGNLLATIAYLYNSLRLDITHLVVEDREEGKTWNNALEFLKMGGVKEQKAKVKDEDDLRAGVPRPSSPTPAMAASPAALGHTS